MATLLGFDFGTAKIGIAVGQTITATANPLTTIRSKKGAINWPSITDIIEEWQPDRIIVGLPKDLDDSDTEITARAQRFARQLEGRYHRPVSMMDEKLTSMEARSIIGRKPKNIEELDAIAAALILETWFSENT